MYQLYFFPIYVAITVALPSNVTDGLFPNVPTRQHQEVGGFF